MGAMADPADRHRSDPAASDAARPPADGAVAGGAVGPGDVPAALELLDVETDKLLRTVDALTDEDLESASICAGWSRGHVVTHLARNAESLVRLVVWARTGVRTPQYPSAADRDADIEAGAPRPAAEQRADLHQACDLVRDALSALALPLAEPVIEMGPRAVDARALPVRRLNEVVLHHADLASGYTLDDAHPLAVADLLELAVDRLRADPAAPAVTLVADEGERYDVAGGGPHVRGTAAGLLGWLTRGDPGGVRTDDDRAPLPALP